MPSNAQRTTNGSYNIYYVKYPLPNAPTLWNRNAIAKVFSLFFEDTLTFQKNICSLKKSMFSKDK